MKYIKKFENHDSYELFITSGDYPKPNVSYCVQENEVYYNPWIEPPYQGFCKLTLNDGDVIELEGSGELTPAMTSRYFSSLVSAEIGEACTSIGAHAFNNRSNLTSVTIGDSVESIGDNAFRDCSGLASVTIGDSVESIGINAFYGCGNLTSIEMPDGVTSIGNTVFYECSSLMSAVIYATTPPTLGNSVFYGNASGRKIYVPSSSVNTYKAASGWSAYLHVGVIFRKKDLMMVQKNCIHSLLTITKN